MLFEARTLNSYSTQGLKSVTEADSCFPLSTSGTERHHRNNLSWKPQETCHWKLAILVMCYLLSFHGQCLKVIPVTHSVVSSYSVNMMLRQLTQDRMTMSVHLYKVNITYFLKKRIFYACSSVNFSLCLLAKRRKWSGILQKWMDVKPTSANSLPTKKEGRPGLDGVTEDWTVVVHPRWPGHSGSGLCYLGHLTVCRWGGGTWKDR